MGQSQEHPAIVFLHGIGGSAAGWTPQDQAMKSAGFMPVALDMVGFGKRPPVETLDFESLAADVELAIADRGLEHPVLLGHSLGGMVVQTLVRRQPQAYRAAILCCTSPAFGSPDGDFQKKFVADRLAPLEAGRTMPDLAAGLVDAILGPSPDANGRALASAMMSATSPQTYRAAVRCIAGFDEHANLGKISLPVLCLAAQHDRNAPAAMMERMAAKIAGARYVCLPASGHLPNLEVPTAFNAAVLDFLRTLPAA